MEALGRVQAWVATVPAAVVLAFAVGVLIGRRYSTHRVRDSWRFTIDLWRQRNQTDETEPKPAEEDPDAR